MHFLCKIQYNSLDKEKMIGRKWGSKRGRFSLLGGRWGQKEGVSLLKRETWHVCKRNIQKVIIVWSLVYLIYYINFQLVEHCYTDSMWEEDPGLNRERAETTWGQTWKGRKLWQPFHFVCKYICAFYSGPALRSKKAVFALPWLAVHFTR